MKFVSHAKFTQVVIVMVQIKIFFCFLQNTTFTVLEASRIIGEGSRSCLCLRVCYAGLDLWSSTPGPWTSIGPWTIWYLATKKEYNCFNSIYLPIYFFQQFSGYFILKIVMSACASLPHWQYKSDTLCKHTYVSGKSKKGGYFKSQNIRVVTVQL